LCGFVLFFIVVVTWLKARGNFIFTDCIVRNRGAIAEPWREYRKEGNSYFKFQLAIIFASIAGFAAVVPTLVFSGGLITGSRHSNMAGLVIAIVLFFVLWSAAVRSRLRRLGDIAAVKAAADFTPSPG
jgi:membrane-anchored glycerophosphoryl diester phosphodiesterase (GDPDase)